MYLEEMLKVIIERCSQRSVQLILLELVQRYEPRDQHSSHFIIFV